jgi:hypothetical protein
MLFPPYIGIGMGMGVRIRIGIPILAPGILRVNHFFCV